MVIVANSSKHEKQLRYLSKSALIEESTTPHIIRSTLMVISLVIIIFIVWASITKVNEVATAPGEVVPGQHIQSIQHLEGGIISTINIKEGDLVSKGQIIIKLNGTYVKQDLYSLKAKQLSLDFQEERLRAFVNNITPDFDSIKADDKLSAAHIKHKVEQQQAYDSMIQARDTEKQVVIEQVSQKHDAIRIQNKKQNTFKANMKLIQKERDIKYKLSETGTISKIQLFKAEKELNNVKGKLDEVFSEIKKAKTELSEYNKRLSYLEAKHRYDAYRLIDNITAESSQNSENIKKLTEQVERLEIRSSAAGLVKSLNVKTIGGVVSPGQLLAEIVPLEGDVLIECNIEPRDIGHVKTGQQVNVKVSSYDFSRYGTALGKLEYLSPTTFAAEDNSRYYLGRVSLKRNYIGKDKSQNLILPGMTVQAEIVTGQKSILEYLLKPIHRSINSAFRER